MNSRLSAFPDPTKKPSRAQPDWLDGPCTLTFKSHLVDFESFMAAHQRLTDLDPSGETWELVKFSHWDTKWVEAIFVKPDSSAHRLCEEMYAELRKTLSINSELPRNGGTDRAHNAASTNGANGSAANSATARHAAYDIGGEG